MWAQRAPCSSLASSFASMAVSICSGLWSAFNWKENFPITALISFLLQALWLLSPFMEPASTWPAWGANTVTIMFMKTAFHHYWHLFYLHYYHLWQWWLAILRWFWSVMSTRLTSSWKFSSIYPRHCHCHCHLANQHSNVIATTNCIVTREMGIKMHKGVKSFWKVFSPPIILRNGQKTYFIKLPPPV